jgi:A/G-specific adenine glycosylase
MLVREHQGLLPTTAQGLLEVPGIGRYTAGVLQVVRVTTDELRLRDADRADSVVATGAVASIVYNESTPVLDGNVSRVLCRLLAISAPSNRPQTVAYLWYDDDGGNQCANRVQCG